MDNLAWFVVPFLGFAFQSRRCQLSSILLSLLCIVGRPTHQSSSVAVSLRFSYMPSRMETRISGTDRRCNVSVIASQSPQPREQHCHAYP
ncbi:hypothetical protein N8128_06255 [Paracoccaceae bacterium]|nr:hypothetical protein [Paracoccaceae bacterium]